MRSIRRSGPALTVLMAGILAALWAVQSGSRPIAFLAAGLVALALATQLLSRPADSRPADERDERSLGEPDLRADDQRFRDIFDWATEGILIQDAATAAFLDANPCMLTLLGYTLEELLELDPVHISLGAEADVRAQFAAVVADESGAATFFEWRLRTKRGREVWCGVSARYIADFEGRGVILSMVRDVSERRQASQAIAYRDRILRAVTMSTAELVKASSLERSMTTLLKAVGEALAVDRLMVVQRAGFETTSGGSLVFGWQRPGVRQLDFTMFTVAHAEGAYQAEIAAWFAPLADGRAVTTYADSATGAARDVLLYGNTVSNLLLPITVAGAHWGHFGADDTRVRREWNAIELDALRTLADVVGSLIERERTVGALQQSEEQFRTVSDTVLDAIVMIGIDGRIRYWNHAAERIFGYSAAEASGKAIHEWLASPQYRAEADRAMDAFVATGHGDILGRTVEMTAIRKDGVEIAVELSINPMTVGSERYAVGIVRDVTARNEADAVMRRMATHDTLTDLPNRRFFVESLNVAISRSNRSGQRFAVLYLDLDHFKDINDTLGHPIGDELLEAVSARLRAHVRDVDTVARLGGDEFAAIQTDIGEPADAAVLADKLVKALDEPFDIDGNEVRSGTSIGIAFYGPESPDAESLLAHADIALYRAKADGRGTYRFFTESMDLDVRKRVTMESELRAALALGQFFLLYQPQVEQATERVVGVEALVRWRHPTQGVISSERFIPTAEKCGLIVPLGIWMFGEVCRQIKSWLDAGIAAPPVGINMSALQFKAPRVLEQSITTILRESDVAAGRIELELSELALMEVAQKQNETLLRLRALGFRIAIDDFGNGYSSLDYLRRFRVDHIKIAHNFVEELGLRSGSATIVRATIGLAHELGIPVVAEGVETAAQLAFLQSWGCREVQGSYFSAPLTPAETAALLRIGSVPARAARA